MVDNQRPINSISNILIGLDKMAVRGLDQNKQEPRNNCAPKSYK